MYYNIPDNSQPEAWGDDATQEFATTAQGVMRDHLVDFFKIEYPRMELLHDGTQEYLSCGVAGLDEDAWKEQLAMEVKVGDFLSDSWNDFVELTIDILESE